MSIAHAPRSVALAAYPTQPAAAVMLGVAASTLSRAMRRHGIVVERGGDRSRHVTAGDVVRLNYVFRRRVAEELAGELVAFAQAHAASFAEAVEAEVTAVLDAQPVATRPVADAFLDELREVLPAGWQREVQRVYRTTVAGPVAIIGAGGDEDVREAPGPSGPVSAAG